MEKVNSFAWIAGLAKKRVLAAGVIAAAVALVGTKVMADDAFNIESFYAVSNNVVYDNTSGDYPIITAIGSRPGVVHSDGHTYTGWSVFAEDSTGSLDLFASATFLNFITTNAYTTPAVGDKIQVDGWWSPFHQIPELSFSTNANANLTAGGYQPNYWQKISSGNAVAARPLHTVADITALGTLPGTNLAIAGYILQINNVTITGSNGLTALQGYSAGVAPTIAQETFTMTDNTGSMTMFNWVTSYSAADLLSGTPIGSNNQYNVEGFVSYNPGGPLEFTPLSLQAVPEPSSILLAGVGIASLLALRRRRS